ncbi:MAG: hypothetical protein KDD65_08785 [Bacteroidetes bacterium]|nr:hypothetical protein [Bacteroidota bacterium]
MNPADLSDPNFETLGVPIDPSIPVYRPVPLVSSAADGRREPLIVLWTLLVLIFVPLGLLEHAFGLRGLTAVAAGVEFDLKLFIPLVFGTLCTLWFGFLWGAIPVFGATLVAALASGMPPSWAIVYACSNPIALAVLSLAYQAIPIRIDMRSFTSVLYYLFAAFIAAIIGSSGSFILVYSTDIDISKLFATWLGSWFSLFGAIFVVCGPLFFFATPEVERWKRHLGVGVATPDRLSRTTLIVAFSVSMIAIFGYLFAIHQFSMLNVSRELEVIDNVLLRRDVTDAMQGHHLIHWVLGVVLGLSCVFWFQAVIRWTSSLRTSAARLSEINTQLQSEVDQRQSAEEKLLANASALEESNTSKDRFFSIISHDLRSPMGSILSISSFLTEHFEEHDTATFRELLGVVHNSAEKLFGLLENLLEWSRLQAGGMQCEKEDVNVFDLTEAVIGLLSRSAEIKHVAITNLLPRDLVVQADINMIRSVIMNLITNAIKFSEPDDSVAITGRHNGEFTEVSVSDGGVGMTHTQVSRLFRIETAFTTKGTADEPGAGLGLIICQEMIEKHGGEILVSSTPGEGSTFRFTLPRRPVERTDRGPTERTEPRETPGAPSRTERSTDQA